ncbi:SCO5389 family protein [Yinghuangia sp. ASG 101]|uniref:SCO5389 family protein n=1 Tax=Yinghuangia sp. ASG 101 TaxID=2896848 RepID=UPI001E5D2907|nr:SCO5389 family protein [Yinghuangia sp. ASG 101]UGQ12666.1 SCO5389 family protein [Yinghuangia sp. ASG 101]
MSLDVSPALLEKAEQGDVDEREFVACVRDSLPYAWQLVSSLATRLRDEGGPFADNQVPPATEAERGQLLRALASDAIRGSLERHFDVRLAFQNCHRVAVFPATGLDTDRHAAFTSIRGQLLNQSPTMRDC